MLRRIELILNKKQMQTMDVLRKSLCVKSNLSESTKTKNDVIVLSRERNAIQIATNQLRHGKVIALPTDTVYGLACSANDANAIQKLYELKGRDSGKPVAICVSSIEQLRHYASATHLPTKLLQQLLPGAVTVVLNKSSNLINPYLNPGIKQIGIRIPDYEFIQKLSAAFVEPIAMTSANKSGEASTLEVNEFKMLWTYLGVIIDGGHLGDVKNENKQRSASTVVNLSMPGFYQIIRNGIAAEHTLDVMKEFDLQPI